MKSTSPPAVLPSSYATLQTTHITLAHVPQSSPTPTPIILVTLNRPEKNNAFTEIMADELERVFTLFDVDDRVKCIVLTGAGKMFCAGADLEIGFLGGTRKDGTAGRLKTATNTEHRDGWDNIILNTQSFWLNLM
jgi:enoyl-CoA hydratase/carnithine racemase